MTMSDGLSIRIASYCSLCGHRLTDMTLAEHLATQCSGMQREDMTTVPYAGHPVMVSVIEQTCGFTGDRNPARGRRRCGDRATHKLGEEGGPAIAHNLTQAVCCEHFRAVMGRCTWTEGLTSHGG